MHRRQFISKSAVSAFTLSLPATAFKLYSPDKKNLAGGMTPVLTRSYNNARSCTNPKETILNVNNVTNQGIRRLFSLPVPIDKRGCEAQPLIAPAIKMNDGSVHDLVILVSMANDVLAYDAQKGDLLWKVSFGGYIKSIQAIDLHLVNDNWGILSTPVIDPDTNLLYFVCWTSPDGTADKAVHSLHALHLSDGSAAHPALSLEGAVYNPGFGLPVQKFVSAERKQRAALLLTKTDTHKSIFIGCGSVDESKASARGWILAVDLASFKLVATFATAVRFSGGGIWQAGQGLSADSKGFIYCMTANGGFDGKTEWGECFLKLKYTPATAGKPASLNVVDWWSPYSDDGRVGRDPSIPNGVGGGDSAGGNPFGDEDLGSGGPVCIESHGILAGAGKDGILYVTDMNNMGKTQNRDFLNPAANYAKLKTPPVWFTFYPGNGINAAPQNSTDLNQYYAGLTHHQHSTPAVYDSPIHGKMLFTWGENGNLRAWSIDANGIPTYLACSSETASPQAPTGGNNHGGMPGGMISLSCNDMTPNTGLVWALVPVGDANAVHTPGILYCYDADNFVNFPDNSKQIKLLWSSQSWGLSFTHPKFNVPVVSGGKVFVPTYDGRIDVYGLA